MSLRIRSLTHFISDHDGRVYSAVTLSLQLPSCKGTRGRKCRLTYSQIGTLNKVTQKIKLLSLNVKHGIDYITITKHK